MTMYEYLWNNIDFVRKRLREQEEYITEKINQKLPPERNTELIEPALFIWGKFREQEIKLES